MQEIIECCDCGRDMEKRNWQHVRCTACADTIRAARARLWKKNNPVRSEEHSKLYKEKNREKYLEGLKAYRKRNRQKIGAYQSEYREKNRDRLKESSRSWRENNRERHREYTNNHNLEKRTLEQVPKLIKAMEEMK